MLSKQRGFYHVILYARFLYVEGMTTTTTMMMMHPYLANEGEETGNKELYFAIYSIMHIHFPPCYVIQQQKRT